MIFALLTALISKIPKETVVNENQLNQPQYM